MYHPKTDARSSRMPAAERRELIIQAAAIEFAGRGLHGTATEDIARRAGITQPYVFRLFGTKKALFIAVVEHSLRRGAGAFRIGRRRRAGRRPPSAAQGDGGGLRRAGAATAPSS